MAQWGPARLTPAQLAERRREAARLSRIAPDPPEPVHHEFPACPRSPPRVSSPPNVAPVKRSRPRRATPRIGAAAGALSFPCARGPAGAPSA